MKYIPCAVTEKVKKIKEEYLQSTVAMTADPYAGETYKCFSGDRFITLEFLEGWMKHKDALTTFKRHAYAEAEELYGAQPVITEHELITGQPYLPEYSPEKMERYLKLVEIYEMAVTVSQARQDHIALDFEKLLKVGINGLISEIKEKQSKLNIDDRAIYPDMEAIEKNDYYESCLIELNAVIDLQKRYAAEARRLSESADSERKKELLRIADMLDRVPAEPAENFIEALQSVNFYIGTMQGLYPLNRPDRYLYPYYKKDIEKGNITPCEAQELIDNFCLLVSTRVFSRAACGFIVGGRTADGKVVENELSYMFLTALDHIRLPDPNGALAVCDDTSDEILSYATELVAKGVTHPAFYNDDDIVKSLEGYGCLHEDAVNYIHTTCAEITVIGKTRAYTTPIVLFVPHLLKKVVSNSSDEITFDEIKSKLVERMYDQIRVDSAKYLLNILEARRNACDPVRASCLIDDCIGRGKNYYNGGEKYTFIQPIFVGMGTVIDSLAAIKHIIYEEKKMTLSKFAEIVDGNFTGNEVLRQYIINKLPHYGNDTEETNELAAWLYSEILNITKNYPIAGGHTIVPGTFSYITHGWGAYDGACYDGKLAGEAYSDGCCPVQGRNILGPTATICSLTSFEQTGFLAGMVVNLKFSPEHISGDNTKKFITLLKTFIKRGGIELQVNVVDNETLIDAQIHPENHGDLIVRIGGYSDYFVRLTEVLQNEVIARAVL